MMRVANLLAAFRFESARSLTQHRRKMRPIVLCLLALACGCSGAADNSPRQSPSRDEFPDTFASTAAAEEFINQLYLKGRVDRVRTDGKSFLVVMTHGSGVAVTGIALYRREWFHWKHVQSTSTPNPGEYLRAESDAGNIVLVGLRSGKRWPLYNPH